MIKKTESEIQSSVSTPMDPNLKNAIVDILSNAGGCGMDGFVLLQEIGRKKIKLEYKGLLYKSLLLLIRSGKLERFYSHQKARIVYRIRER